MKSRQAERGDAGCRQFDRPEAVNIAAQFAARVTLTGVMLTRMDGDGRGGAALSIRHVTGVPIKFLGIGEATDKLEIFDPARLANRILGMGDIVGLVEKAAETIDAEKAEKMAARMKKACSRWRIWPSS